MDIIEIAKECGAYVVDEGVDWTSYVFGENELQQFAQRIEAPHLQRIAELEIALQKQAKAALSGMDSAKRVASQMLHDAKQIQSSLKPELLDSERQANAVLTEENQKLIEVLRERSQRIAELEKDCDILATNYDAARRASRYTADVADQAYANLNAKDKQIEQLRDALADALRYKRADEKLVDIINGLGEPLPKKPHGRIA